MPEFQQLIESLQNADQRERQKILDRLDAETRQRAAAALKIADSKKSDSPTPAAEQTLPPRDNVETDATLPPRPLPDHEVTLPPRASSADDEMTLPPRAAGPADDNQSADVPLTQSRTFGDYELLEEIARGGMGVVFKARQVKLNRIVALKMILSGNLAGEEEVQRFKTEAEAAAALDHWGIVPIYEIGEIEGQHFFSMGFVEGENLSDKIAHGLIRNKRAAELSLKTAEAIAYAHANNVIHRDLKPANVLLDSAGQPKITDFGLAKNTQSDSNLTRTGAVLGTPGYMPPEQASGELNVGPAADVYSLGAILYAMLTGHPPFQSANPLDTLMQVMEKPPIPPRTLNPSIDDDLQTICLKCLEKNIERRYESAQELVDELQRYLNGEPIIARPVGIFAQAWRWCKRKPAVAGSIVLSTILILFLAISGPIIAWQQAELADQQTKLAEEEVRSNQEVRSALDIAKKRSLEAVKAREKAEDATQQAEQERERVEELLYSARISLAHREWLDGRPQRAQQLLNQCPEDRRHWEWHYLDGLSRRAEISFAAQNQLHTVEYSPDGNSFLTLCTRNSTLSFWDARTGLRTGSYTIPKIRRAQFLSDNEHVLVVAGNQVSRMHVRTQQRKSFGDSKVRTDASVVCEDGKQVAIAFEDGSLARFDFESAKELTRAEKKIDSGLRPRFDPTGTMIAGTIGETAVGVVWDATTGEERFRVNGHAKSIHRMRFSPDGSLLASVGGGGHLVITETATGKRRHSIRAHSANVFSVVFSPDGKRVATGSTDHSCRIFDVGTGYELLTVRGHNNPIADIAFSPNGKQLISVAQDGIGHIWNIQAQLAFTPALSKVLAKSGASHLGHHVGFESRVFYGHSGPVYDIAISPDGKLAATARIADREDEDEVQVWSLEDATIRGSYSLEDNYLTSLDWANDNQTLIITQGGAGDIERRGLVTIWNVAEDRVVSEIKGISCMFSQSALNADNSCLAVALGNRNFGELAFYSYPGLELLFKEKLTGERISSIAWTPQGDHLLSTGFDPGGHVHVWNLAQRKEVSKFPVHRVGAFRLAVSNKNEVATADVDGTISLWNWKSGKLLGQLKGHSRYAVDINFSPDGKRLLSSSEDATVKIWSLTSFSELLSFSDHTGPAMGSDWSNSGTIVASVSRDGSLIVRELNKAEHEAEEWVTLYENAFDKELGEEWTSADSEDNKDPDQRQVRNGELVKSLVRTQYRGQFFNRAHSTLFGVELPRQVDVQLDVTMHANVLLQIGFVDEPSDRFIISSVAQQEQPLGYKGTAVMVSPGDDQLQIPASQSGPPLDLNRKYHLRVRRDLEDFQFYVDGQLMERATVPSFETPTLHIAGMVGNLGDQFIIDNLVVRVPASAKREAEIRQVIAPLLAKALVPQIVAQQISELFSEPADQKIAASILNRLANTRKPTAKSLVESFRPVALSADATPEDYRVAYSQAEYFLEQNPDDWERWQDVALARFRAGAVDAALDLWKLADERSHEIEHVTHPLIVAGQALAELSRGNMAVAQLLHQRFHDMTQLTWNRPAIRILRSELQQKIPLESNSLQSALMAKLVKRERSFWLTPSMDERFENVADDFRLVIGRSGESSPDDVQFDRESSRVFDGVASVSNPPPRLQLVYDDIQLKTDDATATIELTTAAHTLRNAQRKRHLFQFRKTGSSDWQLFEQRTWDLDRRRNESWTKFDDDWFAGLNKKIEAHSGEPTAEFANWNLQAGRYLVARDLAQRIVDADSENGTAWQVLGEASLFAGDFSKAVTALESAREQSPTVVADRNDRFVRSYDTYLSVPYGVAVHPNGNQIATGHHNKSVVVWDRNTRKILHTFTDVHGGRVGDVVYSHDGSLLVTAGQSSVKVIDSETADSKYRLIGHKNGVFRLDRHPTRDLFASCAGDQLAKIWDIQSGREIESLIGHRGRIFGVAFSPDGNQVATAGDDGTVRLWNFEGDELLKVDAHPDGGAWRVDWLPHGRQFISCGKDGRVCLWDTASGRLVHEFSGHSEHVEVVRVSPDGSVAASADIVGKICIWDLQTKQQIAEFHCDSCTYNLVFADDRLLSVSKDTIIREWDVNFDRSPLQKCLP